MLEEIAHSLLAEQRSIWQTGTTDGPDLTSTEGVLIKNNRSCSYDDPVERDSTLV